MPRPHISMRKIRDILRLSLHEGLSLRQVAASVQMPFTTVGDHVRRARRRYRLVLNQRPSAAPIDSMAASSVWCDRPRVCVPGSSPTAAGGRPCVPSWSSWAISCFRLLRMGEAVGPRFSYSL